MSAIREQDGTASPPEVQHQLATARRLHAAGQREAAVLAYRRTLELDNRNAAAAVGLAALKYEGGDFAEASSLLRKALRATPGAPDVHHLLGVVFAGQQEHDEAIPHFRETLRHEPGNVGCLMRLGGSLAAAARFSEAADCFERVATAQPEYAMAWNNLGLAHLNLNCIDAAIEHTGRAARLAPDHAQYRSNHLMCLNYAPELSPARIFEEHRAAGASWSAGPPPARAADARTDGRRLRVGFVSPDFKAHSVAYFFEPLLAALDRAAVEIFCYAEVDRPDETTARLHALADHWVSTMGCSDEAVAATVLSHRIDILVDLAGHTRGNRLGVFARRAAPVQATWLGYPATTGLAEMDFRIVDAISDPPGEAERQAIEKLVRLSGGFLCYRPDDCAPEVVAMPCGARGSVTFGSFNNASKINERVVAVWARVLERVPGSRLLLKSRSLSDAAMRDRLTGWFAACGIGGDRIELAGWSRSVQEHLAGYGGIDIALDCFPYNGTATTCEALWMGVPVVTLTGDRHAARVGTSLLTQVGMKELIAADEESYVAIASALADDRESLATWRGGLRDRLRASPLMDAAGFARRMEAAFEEMMGSASLPAALLDEPQARSARDS